ncbi:hypothetical protein D1B31_02295 [Neobacillus notoginsengisoli]|uniref:DUF5668 domain-containing protein n=1 Tax=Neobacillus notoginsengisoli TaxID=1578198 RepID=A0A417Z012_9BACI|nr:hypothetical protein [Neobacillus notoginsengisoli]RHW43509.1 hypothetical protein D1B31_02295 [Neobacillus notoginsengisoli]
MRTWRVGTFTMGAALLFLGVLLLISQFADYSLYTVMLSWWPALLIILGIEILLFLFVQKKENAFLKYDLLSIFIVGLLGTAGIGFAILSSTGVMGKVEAAMNKEERSFELPEYSSSMDSNIKRIVVNTAGYPLTIETSASKEVSIFGTYRTQTSTGEKLLESASDYVTAIEKGDTLYLNMKRLPSGAWPFDSYSTLEAALLVPDDANLDVAGVDSELSLKPRVLLGNWTVDRASEVSLHLDSRSDIKVTATNIQNLAGKDELWSVGDSETKGSDEDGTVRNAVYQTGEGKHSIAISNAFRVNLEGGR